MTPHSQPSLHDEQIQAALGTFGISPEQTQILRIREYTSLLVRWNRSLNLTTVTDPVEIVRRHFGESMFAAQLLPVENCRLADVGSGAGFPGLALKIACPDMNLVLIESNKKKCAFLSEVIRTLGLSGVEVLSERFDQIRPETLQAEIITARALGEFKLLLRWSAGALVRRGHIMLWVGAEDASRLAGSSSWLWQPAAKIPDSQRRFVLVGRPIEAGNKIR
jgi:16S rRNA (guanine527-N7)-methyltransferase